MEYAGLLLGHALQLSNEEWLSLPPAEESEGVEEATNSGESAHSKKTPKKWPIPKKKVRGGGIEGKILPGNSFDFPFIHGEAILAAGYSFVSIRDEVFSHDSNNSVTFNFFDIIYG